MNRWQRFISNLLWTLKPIMSFISVHFTMPFIIKKVKGTTYYHWRPYLRKGMVFITETRGEGSNLLNPSHDGKHGAIYFGFKLKTVLLDHIAKEKNSEISYRLSAVAKTVEDHIPYVLEAVDAGVIATDVITFLTEKDRVKGLSLTYASLTSSHELQRMSKAATMAMQDLGLPYDFGFTTEDNARYCFELVAVSYLKVFPGVDLPLCDALGFKTYQARSFLESKDFCKVLDSDSN